MIKISKILFLLMIPHILLNAASSFSGERLKDACLDFLKDKLGEDKELYILQTPDDLTFKQDNVKAIIDQEVSNQVGINFVALNFISEKDGLIKELKVYYRYTMEKDMPVALKSIRKGDAITAADFTMRRMKLTADEEALAANPEAIIGKKAEDNIPRGALIKTASLESGLKVNRGERVTVVAGGDGLLIRVNAIALHDAKPGQQIRVQREDKQILQGLLKEDGNVEIIRK